METLIAVKPALRQSRACLARFQPLVVMAILPTPVVAAVRAIRSPMSLRVVGSPPVRRILPTPSVAKADATRATSSPLRKASSPVL